MKQPCKRWLGVAALLVALNLTHHAAAQQPVVHYIYDDLGRLAGVVDPDGNVATYSYDAVGNILAIDRHNVADAAGPVAISLVSPNHGKIGTPVSIFGRGFSADPAQNTVSFSGALATVIGATATSLTTTIPPGALTGFITVTTPLGTATSPEPFTIPGVVTVSPTTAVLFTKASQQFTATETGTLTPSVTWSVNGTVGGNTTVGTISATGLYTAPEVAPSPSTITVTATNTWDASLFDSATVVIVEAPDKILTHPVSLAFATPTTTVNTFTAPAVSVDFATSTTVNTLMAEPVSVAIAASTTVDTLTAPAVSIGFAVSITVNTLTAPAVSVDFTTLTGQTAFLTASPVGVSLQPVITSVMPSSGARGVAGLSVLLTGAGMTDATSVSFQLNGSTDANLSVAGLTVSPDGTQATFTLAIASGAVPGPRVVRITTPGGTSTAFGTGGNLFIVQ